MAFTVYRLKFADPLQFYEQFGDPVTSTGGAPVPAQRSALRHAVSVATFDGGEETAASRLKLRRQWRSLVNNTPMKLQGIPLIWDVDPENNGWYMPDQGQLVDLEGSVGLAVGVFKVDNAVWIVAGRPRTHRRARWVYLKDLRTGQWSRDIKRLIYSTDFSGLGALALTYLPPGINDPVTTGGIAGAPRVLPVGQDAGEGYVVSGLVDLARLSFEQPSSQTTKGTVVLYDRRGEQSSPAGGPGTAWEEMYGPDYPYSWTEGFAFDAPVIENERCRVRYSSTHLPGFVIDVWNGSAWVEQCKVVVGRLNGTTNPLLSTVISASVVEYSETRAVIVVVMRAPADPQSREEIYITLQQGWSAPRFEVYTGRNLAGEKVDPYLVCELSTLDADASVVKIDTGPKSAFEATAKGTGHTGLWPAAAALGATGFGGENWVAIGRWGGAYSLWLAVLQAAPIVVMESGDELAYAGKQNSVVIQGQGLQGYLSVHLGFSAQQVQQAQECNEMTLGTGTTSVADAEASGGKTSQAKRTTDANAHVSQATWPNGYQGTYRIFARVKATSGTLKIYAKTGATTGATKTVAAAATPTYSWVDLGEVVANGSTLEIHAWQTAAVNFQVDRIEAFLVEDQTLATQIYQGGVRDLGQSILYDSRAIPTIVSRTT